MRLASHCVLDQADMPAHVPTDDPYNQPEDSPGPHLLKRLECRIAAIEQTWPRGAIHEQAVHDPWALAHLLQVNKDFFDLCIKMGGQAGEHNLMCFVNKRPQECERQQQQRQD